MSLSLLKIKHESNVRDTINKQKNERLRSILCLIGKYLQDHGYLETSHQLKRESGFDTKKYRVADNVGLESILVDYENYCEMKFGSPMTLIKKCDSNHPEPVDKGAKVRERKIMQRIHSRNEKKPGVPRQRSAGSLSSQTKVNKMPGAKEFKKSMNQPQAPPEIKSTGLDLIGKRMGHDFHNNPIPSQEDKQEQSDDNEYLENRILKPLPQSLMFGELRQLSDTIMRDIIVKDPNVRWEDIAGLEHAKHLTMEAVIMPMKFPQYFTGLLKPWNGILLYGPPGTGKTMLAKAVATECETTFFNISASSIVSKWRGESEKLIRVLFELARHYAPSTIFLDELDSVMSQRKGQEHDGSRRMKTELLIQMDGLAKSCDPDKQVFFLAASNLPWDLDQAILRRLEKRILVNLPNATARESIFRKLLNEERASNLNYEDLSLRTEGYSGADITLLCKEAAMRPLRKVMKKLEKSLNSSTDKSLANQVPPKPRKVQSKDVEKALSVTKPSGSAFQDKYQKWTDQFGSNVYMDSSSSSDDDE